MVCKQITLAVTVTHQILSLAATVSHQSITNNFISVYNYCILIIMLFRIFNYCYLDTTL